MQKIPFIGPSYTLPSLDVDSQKTLNMYLESVESGTGKSSAILKKRSGLKEFTSVTKSIRRIYQTSRGRLFAFNGNRVDEIGKSGSITARGTITSNDGSISVADNGNEMIIVDGIQGFIFNLSLNVLTAIADVDFLDNATHVAFQDSFFIVNDPISSPPGKYAVSGVFDGTSWNGLDFANAEGNPDSLTALISTGRELWLLGPQSTQIAVTSESGFPFTNLKGTLSDIGILAPFSLCKMNTNIFFLGADDQGFGQVFMNQGYTPTRISNHALEQQIATYEELEDTTAFCFQERGHYFYVLNFLNANITWVYDTVTGEWYQWAFTDFQRNIDGLYRGNSYAFFNNKNYVSDFSNGKIYELDPNTFDDDGNKIKCLRRSPHIWQALDRTFYSSFQIDMETGVGLTLGQGSDPQVMLRWSIDGGYTWSNEHWRSAGKIGNYASRVKWYRLGASRDRVFEVAVTDPVQVTFLNAFVDIS